MKLRQVIAYVAPGDRITVDALPGLELAEVVIEHDLGRRPALTTALGRITADGLNTLFLPRLGLAANSLSDLVRLIDWLQEAGASLIAADVGLDTATSSGRASLRVLRELEGWDRRPRGRPGLAVGAPDLAGRIVELRERGLSLQAIADRLNADGVPTPRGGASWRPSSVQSALGYRRPHPGTPPALRGAPPPPGKPAAGPRRRKPGPPGPPPPPQPSR